ncbi:MAG TPA: fasciclin domain-containing protein [Allosphingosinicella sp.]
MSTRFKITAVLAALLASPPLATAFAGPASAVAAPMRAAPTVAGIAMASPQHRTLVAAVQAADLAGTLSGSGPFTVFAPTDAAFARLPAGTVETLVRPENRPALQRILTYHVVPGRVTSAQLVRAIRAGRGTARLTTVQGGTLTARLQGRNVVLTDEAGGRATVTRADLIGSNGVVHVTDAVSMPR